MLKFLITLSFISIHASAVTSECFAPKSIGSSCLITVPDVMFQDVNKKANYVLVDSKTNATVDTDAPSTGKQIVLYDLDKSYTIQINKMNRASEGEIISFGITNLKHTEDINKKIATSKSASFYLLNKEVKKSIYEASYLRTKLDRTRFEAKSLAHDTSGIASQIHTSDFSGSKEILADGTEIQTVNMGGLSIDLQNGYVLKSLVSSATNKETKVTLFQSMLGKKVQDAISDFINRHVAALQIHKNLIECRANLGVCPLLEEEYAAADKARDAQFLNMINVEDLKIAPVPALPQPAQQVEVSATCPCNSRYYYGPKTQYRQSYFYYHNMYGWIVVY